MTDILVTIFSHIVKYLGLKTYQITYEYESLILITQNVLNNRNTTTYYDWNISSVHLLANNQDLSLMYFLNLFMVLFYFFYSVI